MRHTQKRTDARECSTGEQKALLISIILADAWELSAAQGGHAPLLLLDEIAAHLDARRRAALFEEIVALGAQAWMTGTDIEMFAPLRANADHFRGCGFATPPYLSENHGICTASQIRTNMTPTASRC